MGGFPLALNKKGKRKAKRGGDLINAFSHPRGHDANFLKL